MFMGFSLLILYIAYKKKRSVTTAEGRAKKFPKKILYKSGKK